MILFYDTETTGLPDFKAPSDADHQPHIVQFAALLVDPVTRAERVAVSLMVKPDGWFIPAEVADIHGITTEMAEMCGIDERIVADLFLDLREQADIEVAHNIRFDRRIMRIAALRHSAITREVIEKYESDVERFCTMSESTAIVNLPPTEKMLAAGFNRPKSPTLTECVRHFFGEDLADAHNALADVRACARVYFHLRDLGRAGAEAA